VEKQRVDYLPSTPAEYDLASTTRRIDMPLTVDQAMEQLDDRRSPRRRSAAERLRKLGDPAAGPPLLQALRRELTDSRTWETQYQMIMAIGACGYRPALPELYDLAQGQLGAPAAGYVPIGDALVRLDRTYPNDPAPLLWCLDIGNEQLIDGALRATAMLRLVFDDDTTNRILNLVAGRDPYDGLRFWVAAAAAGWTGSGVRQFLTDCAAGPRDDVAEAATTSLQGKYQTYRPL
jgi:HEAT repeat protein